MAIHELADSALAYSLGMARTRRADAGYLAFTGPTSWLRGPRAVHELAYCYPAQYGDVRPATLLRSAVLLEAAACGQPTSAHDASLGGMQML